MKKSPLCKKSTSFVLNELSEFERKQFERHLSLCRRCQLDCQQTRRWKRDVEADFAKHGYERKSFTERTRRPSGMWRNTAVAVVAVALLFSRVTLDRNLDKGVTVSTERSVAQMKKIEAKLLRFAHSELAEVQRKI